MPQPIMTHANLFLNKNKNGIFAQQYVLMECMEKNAVKCVNVVTWDDAHHTTDHVTVVLVGPVEHVTQVYQ